MTYCVTSVICTSEKISGIVMLCCPLMGAYREENDKVQVERHNKCMLRQAHWRLLVYLANYVGKLWSSYGCTGGS